MENDESGGGDAGKWQLMILRKNGKDGSFGVVFVVGDAFG
jgi:hypothetical protein